MKNAKSQRCLICGRQADHIHHLISGTANRKIADEYDCLKIPLCFRCHQLAHDDPDWNRSLKQYGQREWERKHGTREDFIRIFGKSWVIDDG